MLLHFHLVVSASGKLRTTKGVPGLADDEIAIAMRLDVPPALFRRPFPVITVKLPEPPEAPIESIVDVSAHAVAAALRVSVDDVRDTLTALVREARA